jgi:hypothetical protein
VFLSEETRAKIIKYLVIFFGLYFFGDFRINDVNVRDFLQSTITPAQLVVIKDKALSAFKSILARLTKVSVDVDGDGKESAISAEKAGEMLKNLDPKDQEKVLELLKKNMDVESALEATDKKTALELSESL